MVESFYSEKTKNLCRNSLISWRFLISCVTSGEMLMKDPAASRRGILEKFSFKSRGKPRGIKPTGGIKF
jgi:hypothetical protein